MYWDGNYIFVTFLFNLQKHYTTDDDNYIFVTLLLNLLQLIYTTDDDNYIFVTFLFNLQYFNINNSCWPIVTGVPQVCCPSPDESGITWII